MGRPHRLMSGAWSPLPRCPLMPHGARSPERLLLPNCWWRSRVSVEQLPRTRRASRTAMSNPRTSCWSTTTEPGQAARQMVTAGCPSALPRSPTSDLPAPQVMSPSPGPGCWSAPPCSSHPRSRAARHPARPRTCSFGATLFAAIEGTPPFGTAENPVAQLHRVAAGQVPPPQQAGPLQRPLMAMLHDDPAARPTMSQVIDMPADHPDR